jgi:GTP pyrophosphokinase
VRKAYRFADEAHLGQIRASGEPYITHPIAVAAQCAEWKLDVQALMAALLHDAIEDCGVTKPELIERFGAPVAELVDGLTKLDKLQFNTREEKPGRVLPQDAAGHGARRARDPGQAGRPLAQHAHAGRRAAREVGRISSETLDIYAPIAHRLGLNATYRELQELAFRYLQPWRYAVLSKAVSKARSRRRDLIQKVQRDVGGGFEAGRHEGAHRRPREDAVLHLQKMDEKHLSFAQVTDIYGFRIIVPTVIDCYTAMGLLHQLYKPVPGSSRTTSPSPRSTATSRCTPRWWGPRA